jgi:hypothetical protein
MSREILDFYCGGQDDQGRTLDEILAWPDMQLEAVHDFIQWLFPLPERSGANPSAPILDRETIAAFHASEELQDRLRQSFLRMLRFYGLEFHSEKIQLAQNFAARSSNWLTPGNHNHLRLTRILRSLRLLGLESEAQALFRALSQLYESHPGRITFRTYEFWKNAGETPC